MTKRRLEQIDQLHTAAFQATQKAERYKTWGDEKMARLHRDIAVTLNRMRYELIQREEKVARTLEVFAKAHRVSSVEDAVFEDVA